MCRASKTQLGRAKHRTFGRPTVLERVRHLLSVKRPPAVYSNHLKVCRHDLFSDDACYPACRLGDTRDLGFEALPERIVRRAGAPANEEEINRPTMDGLRHLSDSVIIQITVDPMYMLVRQGSPTG